MDTRPLGGSGLQTSVIGLGAVVDEALEQVMVRANRAAARWHPSAEDLSELRELLAAQTAAGIHRAQ